LTTDYTVTRDESTVQRLDNATTFQGEDSTRTRAAGGVQTSDYTVADGLNQGL
jgi:hypothetical protein